MSTEQYYPCQCPKCGWIGMSDETEGGSAIADTGDFNDIICPVCVHNSADGRYQGDYVAVEEMAIRDVVAANRKERDELRAKLEASEKQCAAMRQALEKANRELGHLFWTSDDGENTRAGTSEDEDAPENIIEAWRDITKALSTAAGKDYVSRESVQGSLEVALRRIEKWFGEFPATGKTWDDGSPMSYAACLGSNGERDYMRAVAREAIAKWKEGA